MDQVEACSAPISHYYKLYHRLQTQLEIVYHDQHKLACVLCTQSCAGLTNTGAHVSICISMNKEPE